jgi:hypothetical protein
MKVIKFARHEGYCHRKLAGAQLNSHSELIASDQFTMAFTKLKNLEGF